MTENRRFKRRWRFNRATKFRQTKLRRNDDPSATAASDFVTLSSFGNVRLAFTLKAEFCCFKKTEKASSSEENFLINSFDFSQGRTTVCASIGLKKQQILGIKFNDLLDQRSRKTVCPSSLGQGVQIPTRLDCEIRRKIGFEIWPILFCLKLLKSFCMNSCLPKMLYHGSVKDGNFWWRNWWNVCFCKFIFWSRNK